MNHLDLQDKLWEWHDGQLNAIDALVIQTHITTCLGCRGQLAAWKETAQTFLMPLTVGGSREFTQNVLRHIRVAQADRQGRPRFFSRWAFPALALSFSSFAAVVLYIAQPTAVSADHLFLSEGQTTPSEWVTSVAKEDQILGSVVETVR